jgi:aspartyl-tRNA(Asn)/glutamyl-tRNA(Gln) amidotransferase subunit A
MTNMDEFASGSSGETSAFKPVKNPQALGLVPGGSSSGSAAAISAGFCDMALGSDTGGSIRNPASHCGVVGIKPTYSSVSRYGLIDLSMSVDQIGCFAKNVEDAGLLLKVIQGKDENDSISQGGGDFSKSLLLSGPQTAQLRASRSSINNKLSSPRFTIGVLDLSGIKVDSKIQKLIDDKIEQVAKKNKWEIKKIKINHLDLAIETYYPLLYVEFFSATRRFDGRRYGKKIEDVAGPEVLRRILGGSEISQAEYGGRYYHQALKAKKLISQEFEKAFKSVDCIVLPTVPRLPHKIGEKISVEEMYGYDALTIPANLAGNCAVSIPVGKIDNIPVGIQIMCDKFQDEKMLNVAGKFEKI